MWGMTSTGDRVRELLAREGLTQAAFSERIGMDPTKLSKSLNGMRRFSSLDLALIAEGFDVGVDWLLTGTEPEIATAARHSADSSAAIALDLARSYATLRADLTVFGYRQSWTLPEPVPLRGRWIDQGAALAASAVGAVRVAGWQPADPLADLIPAVFGIDVAVQQLGEGFDGLAVATPDARLILTNTVAVPGRQRFTIAHELGHLLASDDQGIHRDDDIFGSQSKQGESEVRANAFAAAFLMPEDAIREVVDGGPIDQVSFCQLATDLGVTPTALAFRLENLGFLDAATTTEWRTVTGERAAQIAGVQVGFARRSVESLTPRPPLSLVNDTFTAYQDGEITLRPYAQLLGVPTDVLRRQLAQAGAE